jgi:hypothetical protein
MQLHTHSRSENRERLRRSIVATIACLRSQRQIALLDRSALRLSLLRHDTAEGLHALERLCLGLLVIDQLVELVGLAAGNGHERQLAIARDLRSRTVKEVLPVLAAARHDLPGAPEVIRSFLEMSAEPDGEGAIHE